MGRLYPYVGPEAIRLRSASSSVGSPIQTPDDLRNWLGSHRTAGKDESIAATFVIDSDGRLRLADRRSEHVACAGGNPVLSAGEMFFSFEGDSVVVEEVSNLSTGYCPEPESWDDVSQALDRLGVRHPGRFSTEIVFRLCRHCGERNVVKDGYFDCLVCGAKLPSTWNFSSPSCPNDQSASRMIQTPYRKTITTVKATLTSVFDEIDGWFEKPTDSRSFRPQSGGWSVDEVVEHITLTNHYLLLVIRKSTRKALARAVPQGPMTEAESDLKRLEPIGERGAFHWPRPDHMVPSGDVSSEEVRSLMRDQVRECFDVLDSLGGGEGSLHRVRMSVNNAGHLDVYQWLQFLALHARRHLAQMTANESEWRARTGSNSV